MISEVQLAIFCLPFASFADGHPRNCADDFFLFITVMYVVDILVRFYGLGWRSFRANGWNMFDIIVASGSLLTTISVRVGASGYLIDQLQKLFLVSIAFKLVQRMNNLNKLFKTAVYVAKRYRSHLFFAQSIFCDCQLEFAGHLQPALALARAVHVLRHPFRGSFQPDQVEYCRDSRSELFDDG